jgi:hypothetical protein
MSTVPVKSLVATIRATQDIWCRRRDDNGLISSQILFPSSALQLWDHHLHTSGLIPHAFSVSNQTPTIYEQDWVCSYQSVTCFPQEGLIELTIEDGDGGSAQSHVWVDRVGDSTLYLCQLITLYDEVVATAVRVLSRRTQAKDSSNTDYQQQKRPAAVAAPFTDLERDYFETDCAADDIFFDYQGRLAEKYNDDDEEKEDPVVVVDEDIPSTPTEAPAENSDGVDGQEDAGKGNSKTNGETDTQENGEKAPLPESEGDNSTYPTTPSSSPTKPQTIDTVKKRQLTLHSTLSLETFGTFLPQLYGKHVLTVQVGPQHLDYVSGGDGRFADTTWLAEIALQALVAARPLMVQQTTPSSSSATVKKSAGTCSLAVRYRSVAMLGNRLHCSLHGGDRVCMVRSAIPVLGETEGNEILVLVAKAELL